MMSREYMLLCYLEGFTRSMLSVAGYLTKEELLERVQIVHHKISVLLKEEESRKLTTAQ